MLSAEQSALESIGVSERLADALKGDLNEPYAHLSGHKGRVLMHLNAWKLWNTSLPKDKNAKRIILTMRDRSSELHPILTSAYKEPVAPPNQQEPKSQNTRPKDFGKSHRSRRRRKK